MNSVNITIRLDNGSIEDFHKKIVTVINQRARHSFPGYTETTEDVNDGLMKVIRDYFVTTNQFNCVDDYNSPRRVLLMFKAMSDDIKLVASYKPEAKTLRKFMREVMDETNKLEGRLVYKHGGHRVANIKL